MNLDKENKLNKRFFTKMLKQIKYFNKNNDFLQNVV